MTPHHTHMPLTTHARYARRIRNRAVLALSPDRPPTCNVCHAPQTFSRGHAWLQIDHTHGGGDAWRRKHASRGEYRRIASGDTLPGEFRLLCPACHAAAPTTKRFTKAGA